MLVPYYFKDNDLFVFLQRRSNDTSRNPNSLGAFGGGIEDEEGIEEGLLREVYEELRYKPTQYLFLGTFEDNYSISNYYIEKVNADFEEHIIVNEGVGGEWHKAVDAIERDDISFNTKRVLDMLIKKPILMTGFVKT